MVTLLLAGALLAEPAEAAQPIEPPPMQAVQEALRVDAGASCLRSEQLTSVIATYLRTTEVDARLEVDIVGDPEDPLSIEYTVRRRGEVIAIRKFDADTQDCDQLHAVVGVSVALALDATVVLPEPKAEPKPEPPPKSEPPPPVQDDPELAPELDARPSRRRELEPSPWTAAIAAHGGVALEAPPQLGGMGSIAAELRWRDAVDLSLGVVGSSAPASTGGAGRAVFSLVGARADLCGGFRLDRVRPRGCVGLIGGGALATGRAFATSSTTSRVPWMATAFGVDVRIRVAPRVELELGADGIVHILQPAFDFLDEDGARNVGREFPLLGGWLNAGVVVRFR